MDLSRQLREIAAILKDDISCWPIFASVVCEKAAAIIEKLPVTADGAALYAGMQVWDADGEWIINQMTTGSEVITEVYIVSADPYCDHEESRFLRRNVLTGFYSTREATEKARKPC